MKRIPIGRKLYIEVISVFLIFAATFIVYQHMREKQYKIDTLDLRLQNYNEHLAELLKAKQLQGDAALDHYVKEHMIKDLRVTIIRKDGKVTYDNLHKQYIDFSNHANRPEIQRALATGKGSAVERNSPTLNGNFFYSATSFPDLGIIIRSALPYDDSLMRSLRADQHYLWFALMAILILVVLLYRFTSRLGQNISQLRIFASRADAGMDLDTEDLVAFTNDELGEIAERIIKIYRRLETTRQEQDCLKRQLTQNIAHELKTPVAGIQGYLETILETPNLDEGTRQRFLERSFAQSQRLTSLLQDISLLNQMDDGGRMVAFTTVDVSQMVEDIAGETALQFSKKNMTFRHDLPANIVIKGNTSMIYSIFRNLIDNAIAYAGPGTTLTLTANREGNDWHFICCDNGVGVAPEHLSRLFERFYRVDKGRSRKMGGTGLGLAIVKNAVLLHRGTIHVSNQPTGGLRFDFTLPQ